MQDSQAIHVVLHEFGHGRLAPLARSAQDVLHRLCVHLLHHAHHRPCCTSLRLCVLGIVVFEFLDQLLRVRVARLSDIFQPARHACGDMGCILLELHQRRSRRDEAFPHYRHELPPRAANNLVAERPCPRFLRVQDVDKQAPARRPHEQLVHNDVDIHQVGLAGHVDTELLDLQRVQQSLLLGEAEHRGRPPVHRASLCEDLVNGLSPWRSARKPRGHAHALRHIPRLRLPPGGGQNSARERGRQQSRDRATRPGHLLERGRMQRGAMGWAAMLSA
mmetsp:Transcript_10569/g.26384  ORF Transcript_10569/g.26384 Transcript_10569/m.26384 type:complete len:276 (+) Transcript_10569:1195-2022(+)